MIGNMTLFHDIEKIQAINGYLKKGAFTQEFLENYHIKTPVNVHLLRMSPNLQESLSYLSKIDRTSLYIKKLIEDGEKQALTFLKAKKMLEG